MAGHDFLTNLTLADTFFKLKFYKIVIDIKYHLSSDEICSY